MPAQAQKVFLTPPPVDVDPDLVSRSTVLNFRADPNLPGVAWVDHPIRLVNTTKLDTLMFPGVPWYDIDMDYHTRCFNEWRRRYGVYYYAAPREDFSMGDASRQAWKAKAKYLVVEDLS